jgi:hypothetical protein
MNRYQVEGSNCDDRECSTYDFDGTFAPFAVHDIVLREPVAAAIESRELAQQLCDVLNACDAAGVRSTVLQMQVDQHAPRATGAQP